MKVDPGRYRIVRRRTLFGLAAGFGIVALALPSVLYFYIERFRARVVISAGQLEGVSTAPLQLAIYANAVLFLVPAAFLFWYASRALRSGAFPPPGTWVLEGQQVHLGSRARLRALIVLAAGACCLAIGGAWIALALTIMRLGQP